MSNKLFVSNASMYFVQINIGRKDAGKTNTVQIIVEPASGPAYLRTLDDGEWKDNPLV